MVVYAQVSESDLEGDIIVNEGFQKGDILFGVHFGDVRLSRHSVSVRVLITNVFVMDFPYL